MKDYKEIIEIKPSDRELACREQLIDMFLERPIPNNQILENLEVYMRPQRLFEIFSFYELYKNIVDVPGCIMEFGVRWGRHLAVFNALSAYFEPYNFYRKLIGFDTFEGFLEPSEKDGESNRIYKGAMAVTEAYKEYLEKLMLLHQAETPMSHIKKCELYQGDAPVELDIYLKKHPETVVAFAYFDMDVYEPTKKCLELLRPFLTKGSIIAFDELLHPQFPGETMALKEVLDIAEYNLRKLPGIPYPTYICIS